MKCWRRRRLTAQSKCGACATLPVWPCWPVMVNMANKGACASLLTVQSRRRAHYVLRCGHGQRRAGVVWVRQDDQAVGPYVMNDLPFRTLSRKANFIVQNGDTADTRPIHNLGEGLVCMSCVSAVCCVALSRCLALPFASMPCACQCASGGVELMHRNTRRTTHVMV